MLFVLSQFQPYTHWPFMNVFNSRMLLNPILWGDTCASRKQDLATSWNTNSQRRTDAIWLKCYGREGGREVGRELNGKKISPKKTTIRIKTKLCFWIVSSNSKCSFWWCQRFLGRFWKCLYLCNCIIFANHRDWM